MVSLAVPTSEAQPSVLVPETKHPFFKGLTVWPCWNHKLPRIHVKKSIVKSSCLLIFIPKTSTSCPPFWRSCIMFHLALWQFDWSPCNNSPLNLAFFRYASSKPRNQLLGRFNTKQFADPSALQINGGSFIFLIKKTLGSNLPLC